MTGAPRFDLVRMTGRDRAEPNRVATPFELFFDLVFVVSVSYASENLFDLESEGHVWQGLGAYAMVFFAIWWAWMNFTWFATAFDTDDWLYRLTTIVQMGGALVLAAGTTAAMQHADFTVVTIGYIIMTLAIVTQWLRAGIQSAEYRSPCFRHAAGAAVVQIAWVIRLLLPPEIGLPLFFVLVVAELLVPVFSDFRTWTPSNPHHVAERYGLFTLIVLGEGVLASSKAIISGVNEGKDVVSLATLGACGLIIVAAMWWQYFTAPFAGGFASFRSSFLYGYAHYLLFAAAGAVSAGIEITVGVRSGESTVTGSLASATLTLPIVAFTTAVWILAIRPRATKEVNILLPALIAAIGVATFLPKVEVWVAALMVGMVITLVTRFRLASVGTTPPGPGGGSIVTTQPPATS